MSLRVLLLADQNARGCIAVLRSLVGRPGVEVHISLGAQTRPATHFSSYSAYGRLRTRTRYEVADEPRFIASLLAIRGEIGDYVLLPVGERILRWAIEHQAELSAAGVQVPTVDVTRYLAVSDKLSFCDLADAHGLPVPRREPGIPAAFTTSYVLKSAQGAWNTVDVLQAPAIVENAEAHALVTRMGLKPEAHFHQPYIDGPSYYYCVACRAGEKLLAFSQVTLVQQPGGKSVVKAAPAAIPAVYTDAIDRLLAATRWEGVAMFELKAQGDTFYAIECNPRLWGPLQLALDNGYDFVGALLAGATGQPAGPYHRPPGRPTGYVWRNGYLDGLGIARATRSRFQRYGEAPVGMPFPDLWLRPDTAAYYFVEAGIAIARSLAKSARPR